MDAADQPGQPQTAALLGDRSHDRRMPDRQSRQARHGPHTGKATSPETVRYEGRCKVQTSGGLAAENTEGGIVQALGAVTPVWSLYLHLLRDHGPVSRGRRPRITAATDPNLKGRKFRLLNMQSEKTHAPHAGGTSRK